MLYIYIFETEQDIYCTRGLFILIFPFAHMLCKGYILFNLSTVHNGQSWDSPCYMTVVLSGIWIAFSLTQQSPFIWGWWGTFAHL